MTDNRADRSELMFLAGDANVPRSLVFLLDSLVARTQANAEAVTDLTTAVAHLTKQVTTLTYLMVLANILALLVMIALAAHVYP